MAQRQNGTGGGGGGEDRDKTPTARMASPPAAAESNTAQSTISRLENKYADILNKIARRKRQEQNGDDDGVGDVVAAVAKPARSRVDRDKTLEADNTAVFKNSNESLTRKDDIGGFSGLSKSATVIHVPQAKKSDTAAAVTKAESKYGANKEDKATNGKHTELLSNGTSAGGHSKAARSDRNEKYNGNGDIPSYLSRYKARNERDVSNRYKDTSELIESLKSTPKSDYDHYGHYDHPGVDSVSSYYKSRYGPEAYGIGAATAAATAEKPSASSSASSAASRRTKSYRTRKEASKERKHLTMKLSAVNMDIDSPPPPATTAASSSKPAGSSASGRTYKQYGSARKSLGTGLTSGGGYQRSQTQKLLYDFDDNDIYHPPTPRDNKRKEIQNVIRKYAQYDDEDLRRNAKNPYYSNAMKSATSANLAYLSQAGGAGAGSSSGSHLYSDRRDPIAEHYGLGSSYYPRSHYGYDYPSYGGSSALSKPNPYSAAALGSASSAALSPYNPLSKTMSSAAVYNNNNHSSYLGSSSSAAQSAAAAAAARSRKNLYSFVRELFVGVVCGEFMRSTILFFINAILILLILVDIVAVDAMLCSAH